MDEELMKKFKTIPKCISSQYQINLDKFEKYRFDTAKHYMSKYPWYPMPATVHKVLIHGRQIVESIVLPIGYFGEEGSEAENIKFLNKIDNFMLVKTAEKKSRRYFS